MTGKPSARVTPISETLLRIAGAEMNVNDVVAITTAAIVVGLVILIIILFVIRD